jgi:hypothetical protein
VHPASKSTVDSTSKLRKAPSQSQRNRGGRQWPNPNLPEPAKGFSDCHHNLEFFLLVAKSSNGSLEWLTS